MDNTVSQAEEVHIKTPTEYLYGKDNDSVEAQYFKENVEPTIYSSKEPVAIKLGDQDSEDASETFVIIPLYLHTRSNEDHNADEVGP